MILHGDAALLSWIFKSGSLGMMFLQLKISTPLPPVHVILSTGLYSWPIWTLRCTPQILAYNHRVSCVTLVIILGFRVAYVMTSVVYPHPML